MKIDSQKANTLNLKLQAEIRVWGRGQGIISQNSKTRTYLEECVKSMHTIKAIP